MKKLIRPPRRIYPFADLTGMRFNRLVVQWPVGKSRNGAAMWLCLCDCGKLIRAEKQSLSNEAVKSCGCWKLEQHTTHGQSSGANGRATPTYKTWAAMKIRCNNPNHVAYKKYGGRGITVCERWLNSFENFLADMGERPAGKTIDRINNDLGYFKENCRWATPSEQQANRYIMEHPREFCKRGHRFDYAVNVKSAAGKPYRSQRCHICDRIRDAKRRSAA